MERSRKTIRSCTVHLILAVFLALPWTAYGYECTSEMFSDQSFDTPTSTFTPYDKIYVRIDCRNLEAGSYTMDVNWVHQREGIVRSDSHEFNVDQMERKKRIFFWFKLSRRGPLKSAITNQDFYEGHFGNWTVRAFLNEEQVIEAPFTISY